ncbi:MAG: DUF1203 domain-containing protein [Blastocatellales bacterium]
MPNFKIVPIPTNLSREIREKLVDDSGHQLNATPAGDGRGPCRSCLRPFIPADMRILFSYSPNDSDTPYSEIGPIYIHENECEPYQDVYRFPEEIEADNVSFPLTLRCYDSNQIMVHAELARGKNLEGLIESLFENPGVEYLHARNAEYGCFIAKIERR